MGIADRVSSLLGRTFMDTDLLGETVRRDPDDANEAVMACLVRDMTAYDFVDGSGNGHLYRATMYVDMSDATPTVGETWSAPLKRGGTYVTWKVADPPVSRLAMWMVHLERRVRTSHGQGNVHG